MSPRAMAVARRRARALACARDIARPKYTGAIPLPPELADHPATREPPTEVYENPEDDGGWRYVIEPKDGSWIAFVGVDGKALLWTKRADDGGVVGAPYIYKRPDLAASSAAASRPTAHISLARFVDASTGSVPTAFRILAAGENATDKGPLVFTPRSAKLVMEAWQARGNPLVGYYEHEDRLPLEQRAGAPMKGAASAPSSALAIRGPAAAPECWAQDVAWTEEAQRQIKAGERRQISPVAAFDPETREVLEIVNFSLVAEGATHNGTLLLSRDGADNHRSNMDDIIQQIMDALESGDFEAAETLVQQAEAMADGDGGDAMSKLSVAKACMKGLAAKAAPLPPPPAKPEVAQKRLAASRDAFARAGVDGAQLDRAFAELSAATRDAQNAARDSRRATVKTLITAHRDLFDVVDEREHMNAADPQATERHIASLSRKVKAGVVALAKPGEERSEARPGGKKPEGKPEGKPEDQATAADRSFVEQFNRSERDPAKRITLEDYMASKAKHGGGKPVVGVA